MWTNQINLKIWTIINTKGNFINFSVLQIHILSLKCILPYSKPLLKSRWAANTCFYCQRAKLLTHSTLQLFSFWQNSLRKMLILNARNILLFVHGKRFCDMNWDDLVYVKSSGTQREKVSWFHSGTLQKARVLNPHPDHLCSLIYTSCHSSSYLNWKVTHHWTKWKMPVNEFWISSEVV